MTEIENEINSQQRAKEKLTRLTIVGLVIGVISCLCFCWLLPYTIEERVKLYLHRKAENYGNPLDMGLKLLHVPYDNQTRTVAPFSISSLKHCFGKPSACVLSNIRCGFEFETRAFLRSGGKQRVDGYLYMPIRTRA